MLSKLNLTISIFIYSTLLIPCYGDSPAASCSSLIESLSPIIAAPTGSEFDGPSGQYGPVMARAIAELKPVPDGLDSALNFLLKKRKEVLALDLAAAKNDEQRSSLKEQLESLSDEPDSVMHLRMTGKGPADFHITTPIFPGLRYSPLYEKLEKKGMGFVNGGIVTSWTPETKLPEGVPSYPALSVTWDGIYHVNNAYNQDIPLILRHLRILWNEVLRSQNPAATKKKIAEFEWWFFAANPTGRGGAALGDLLSISLQRAKGFSLRSTFINLDFEVLSRGPEEYIEWRTNH